MTDPYYQDEQVTVLAGDCLDVMAEMPAESVHAIVTDPPYGLGFMGREWDDLPPGEPWARECLRVLKPGGHLLAFGGSRTWHRLATAVEDAGFEIRDSIAWLYGSGFPKSLDVSKAIDKAAGAEREVVGPNRFAHLNGKANADVYGVASRPDDTAPATPDAERWQGWGTALKPAFEPIVVARKPLTGTVAANVLAHGTGALNIDACRVETTESLARPYGGDNEVYGTYAMPRGTVTGEGLTGRWPTNVLLDDTQAAELDRQSGILTSGKLEAHHTRNPKDAGILGAYGSAEGERGYGDTGGASRFFPTFRYEAKAPTEERPRYNKSVLRLRDDLTPEQVDHVRARLAEAGVRVD